MRAAVDGRDIINVRTAACIANMVICNSQTISCLYLSRFKVLDCFMQTWLI